MNRALLLYVLLLPFVLVWFFQPHFALMDDANLLQLAERAQERGFASTVWQEFTDDVNGWGMWRPLYWIYATLVYTHFTDFLYYWNAGFVLFSVVFLLYAMYEAYYRQVQALYAWQISALSFVALGLASFFAFPWTYTLFEFSSLQEKFVFLAGALHLLFLAKGNKWSAWAWYVSLVVLFVFGISTKAQFIILLPALALACWHFQGYRFTPRVVAYCLFSLAAVLLLQSVAAKGGYTKGYQFALVLANIQQSKSVWLFLLLLFSYLVLVRRNLMQNRILLFPALVLASFIIVFLPWKFGGYLNSFLAPFFAVIAIQFLLAFDLSFPKGRPVIWFALFLFPLLSAWRLAGVFQQSRDLATLLRSPEIEEVQQPIWMFCEEGAKSAEYFARSRFNRNVTIRYPLRAGSTMTNMVAVDGFDLAFLQPQVVLELPDCNSAWVTETLQLPLKRTSIVHTDSVRLRKMVQTDDQ